MVSTRIKVWINAANLVCVNAANFKVLNMTCSYAVCKREFQARGQTTYLLASEYHFQNPQLQRTFLEEPQTMFWHILELRVFHPLLHNSVKIPQQHEKFVAKDIMLTPGLQEYASIYIIKCLMGFEFPLEINSNLTSKDDVLLVSGFCNVETLDALSSTYVPKHKIKYLKR